MATHARIRGLLYAENFLVTFAVGVFLSLPLYLKAQGRDEVFFSKIFAIGAVGAIACVLASGWLLRRIGLARLAPWGSLLFCTGSGLYLLAATRPTGFVALLCLASLLQGIGWGLFLTQGPLCMSSTVEDEHRAYHFMIYGAYNTLGLGLAPVLCSIALKRHDVGYAALFGVATATSFAAFVVSVIAARRNVKYASVGQIAGTASVSNTGGLLRVWQLPSAFFLFMVMLCASVYTSMTNFQATFAAAMQMDDVVFFSFYAIAVVSARFGLSKSVSGLSIQRSVPGLALLMLIAVALLFAAPLSIVCYAVGAMMLGVSYGLLYPTIQAQTMNHAPAALQPQALIAFTLSYLLVRYLFPYAGALAVRQFGYGGLMVLLLLCAATNLAIGTYFLLSRPRHK